MRRYTQRELRQLVAAGCAVDITNGDNETRRKISDAECYYTQVGYSSGKYGCTGMLLQGHKTGTLYAVCARTTAIYIF